MTQITSLHPFPGLVAVSARTLAVTEQRLRVLETCTPGRCSVTSVITVDPLKRLRAVATKGVWMATPNPDTSRVVALLSDHGQRLRVHFLNDGRIDAHEDALLRGVEDATFWAQEADDGRLAAIALLNVNELSDWQRRKWRERQRDYTPLDAA